MFLCRISTGEAEWDRPENRMHFYLDAVFSAWLSSHVAGKPLRNCGPRNHRIRFARQPSGSPWNAMTLGGSVNAPRQRLLLPVLTSDSGAAWSSTPPTPEY